MSSRPVKASDIDDVDLLTRIAELSSTRTGMGWVLTWDIAPWYPDLPWKVVAAKLRRLYRRGLLDGCPCGCRGDFTVTAKGLELCEVGS